MKSQKSLLQKDNNLKQFGCWLKLSNEWAHFSSGCLLPLHLFIVRNISGWHSGHWLGAQVIQVQETEKCSQMYFLFQSYYNNELYIYFKTQNSITMKWKCLNVCVELWPVCEYWAQGVNMQHIFLNKKCLLSLSEVLNVLEDIYYHGSGLRKTNSTPQNKWEFEHFTFIDVTKLHNIILVSELSLCTLPLRESILNLSSSEQLILCQMTTFYLIIPSGCSAITDRLHCLSLRNNTTLQTTTYSLHQTLFTVTCL